MNFFLLNLIKLIILSIWYLEYFVGLLKIEKFFFLIKIKNYTEFFSKQLKSNYEKLWIII